VSAEHRGPPPPPPAARQLAGEREQQQAGRKRPEHAGQQRPAGREALRQLDALLREALDGQG
jgi:hypothetical protein